MNQHLQILQDYVQQAEHLTAEEKVTLLKSIKDADSAFTIAEFKLDRTEKVKRTTAILLEETIEELEQKRKAIEAQNRELEVESSLERVRTVAMGMRKPDDMLEVCRIISGQLELLNVKDIRNVQTAIFYEGRGTYMNYEYYAKHDKTFITEVDFNNHQIQLAFAKKMMKGANEEVFEQLKGKKLQDWFAYQETTNQFADQYLLNADSLNYYWYSLGPVALGISTYYPLTKEETVLFKRFLKVFELAYRRYLDIEKAEGQAYEAKIESSLERVRAQAMAMRKPDELTGICEVLYKELESLGFTEIRNAMINIHDDEKETFVNYDYSDEIGKSINHLTYHIHPLIEKQIKEIRNAEGFSETSYKGKDLEDMITFRKKIGEKDDPRIEQADALYYYFYSIGTGSIGISTFKIVAGEKLEVLKRFRNVFTLAYQRYTDIAQAEAQAREAQIETALERVRSRTMGMQKSEELKEVIKIVFQQLAHLKINLDHAGFVVDYKPGGDWHFWIADEQDIPAKITHPWFDSVWANQFNEAKENGADLFTTHLSFEEKNKFYNKLLSYVPGLPQASKDFYFNCPGLAASTVLFENVSLYIENFSGNPYTEDENNTLLRFGKVFQQTYTRFLDLQKAEAQTREAQIEAALEKVRSRTMAMQSSNELQETAAVLFQEFKKLGTDDMQQVTIGIYDEEKSLIDFRVTSWAGGGEQENRSFQLDMEEPTLVKPAVAAWKAGKKSAVFDLTGDALQGWLNYRNKISGITINTQDTGGRRVITAAYFSRGHLTISTPIPLQPETIKTLERFATVFDGTYTRFLDLEKAEAQAMQAEQDLIAIKEAKQKAEEALTELQITQKQLIQSEKMASLGELTAGIAHEIQNPLNFVNNFSEVSNELIDEMNAEIEKGDLEEAKLIASDIKQNLEKINHHGKRADAIVKGMLQHSRSSTASKEPADINKLADEYLRLAYHGLRAKDKSFNATMKTDFDETIGNINIIPQDIGRVILNLITNAFYVVAPPPPQGGISDPDKNKNPTVWISTKKVGDKVFISVRDNGAGIPQKILDKIFQPFFTTKPTGQGTGLGLSLSYDIVKAHGGELKVKTKESEGTEFIVELPLNK